MHTTLVTTHELAAHLTDERWVVVDCRFDLADPARGERAYLEGHVPGAVYAHLERDLSGRPTGTNGRHPLPTIEQLRACFGRLGIAPDCQVVAYDLDTGAFASRLWWLLRYMGHDAAAVLDGGLSRWTTQARPLRHGGERRAPRVFGGTPRPDLLVSATQVRSLVGQEHSCLLDARAPERYSGDLEPLDPVAGHIPGAVSHFFMRNLAPDKTFLPVEELRTTLRAALGQHPVSETVAYCGSGVTACHNLLALEHAGLPGAKLYAGSWSEWVSDSERPVERTPRAGR